MVGNISKMLQWAIAGLILSGPRALPGGEAPSMSLDANGSTLPQCQYWFCPMPSRQRWALLGPPGLNK